MAANPETIARIKAAFDSDSIGCKNLMLRKSYDEINELKREVSRLEQENALLRYKLDCEECKH